jgi:thiol:disulfide interchange protein
VLREVASSLLWKLSPVALVVAGLACGSAANPAASGQLSSTPVIVIPPVDSAPVVAAPTPVASTAPAVSPRATAIAWITSERDARDRARRQNLPLLVYVRAAWAAPCLEMERRAWRDPGVVAAASGFVPLQLDVTEAEGNAELYAQRYGVTTIPEILVVDPSGRTVATSRGGASAEALVALLRDAAGE